MLLVCIFTEVNYWWSLGNVRGLISELIWIFLVSILVFILLIVMFSVFQMHPGDGEVYKSLFLKLHTS